MNFSMILKNAYEPAGTITDQKSGILSLTRIQSKKKVEGQKKVIGDRPEEGDR